MSSGPPLIVVADPIDAEALRRLEAGPCRVLDASSEPAKLAGRLAEAWALVVRSRTRVTPELLGQAPGLRWIARAGVGVDNIDMAEASARSIGVVNAPTAATVSVSELTIALILVLLRNLYPQIRATKEGTWARGALGTELAGKTVGFVGYGRIAREVAARLPSFRAQALGHDPFLATSPDATPLVSLEELLRRSDIVSLHAALTDESRHLIDAAKLRRMRPGSFLVNVARGPLVDEAALLEALDSGPLAGAALDVFEVEPPARKALLEHPRVVPTPHVGASTHEAQARAGGEIVDELLRILRGEPARYCVNPGGSVRG